MNIINVKIDFEHGICRNKGISVVTGDYNSTKVVFEFADEIDGTKIFEMKNPEGELVYADEIVNNEVILVGYKEENEETETYSLFAEEGDYIFEVSLYGNDSKLTSVSGYINATKEQVIVEGEEVQEKITLFDNLMQEVNTAISETNNLDLDVSKEGNTSTVTITKKDGTPEDVEILDGEDGVSLENIEIVDRNLEVTYGGETENLGQVAPNIQVGTTTTGLPNTSASVVNVGTDLNPILNFTIPKGEAGSIKFEIVEQLPTQDIKEDTIYLVPYTKITVQTLPTENIQLHTIYIVESTGKRYVYNGNKWIEISNDNQYIEYVYINNFWEELGSIDVDINLDDYYTKTETNTLLNTKQPLIDNNNKLPYSLISNTPDLTDYVKNTDYATNVKGGVLKTGNGTYLDGNGIIVPSEYSMSSYNDRGRNTFISKGTLENVLTAKIGDIQTLLDNLNNGGGVQ